MNASVAATEMLKFVMPPSSLHSMNSRMSGWSTRRTPMFAPRPVQAAVGSPRAALTAAPPSRPRVQAAQERSLVRDHVVALELPRWARVGREPGLLRGREEPDLLGKRVDAVSGNHPQLIHGA